MFRTVLLFCLLLQQLFVFSQTNSTGTFTGQLLSNSKPVAGASIQVLNSWTGAVSDSLGKFILSNVPAGECHIRVSAIGFAAIEQVIEIKAQPNAPVVFIMDEATTALEAIVVTAQKVEEEMQQIPASVSVLSSRQVQEYRLWSIQEITAIAPNLYASNPGDNRNVTSIRGITNASYDPSVVTYIDGVNQFGLDTYMAQLFDIERIEVLRGPQGTLYGRNAMGGVVSILTKQPSSKSSGFAELNVGSHGQQRYGAGFRAALTEKLQMGISFLYDGSDGFYTNVYNHTHFDRKRSGMLNYFIKYRISPAWQVGFNVKAIWNRNAGAFPLAGSFEEALDHPFEVNQNATSTMVDNLTNSSFSIEHAGANFNFSMQTAWQHNYRFYKDPLDGDFSPADIVTLVNDYGRDWNTSRVITNEIKFTSPATGQRFKWTAGLYSFFQRAPGKQAVHYGVDAGAWGVPETNFSMINTNVSDGRGAAIFGQVSYSLTDRFDIVTGLRVDYEKKEQSVKAEYQNDLDPENIFVVIPDTTANASFHAISPKLGLTWRLNENGNLYLNYSRGFRAGGLTQLSQDPGQPALYRYNPEYSNTLEAGIKKQFLDNKLRLNAAVFYILATDVQVPTLTLPEAITITKNAGELESTGVECEILAIPVRGVSVQYNAGYTHARYTSLMLSKNGEAINLAGNKQIFTPSITSMLALQYIFPLSASRLIKGFVRSEWMHSGDIYFDLTNSLKQPGYSIFNARVGVQIKEMEFMVWARNLTDTHYISYAYDFGASHLGNPLNYGITCSIHF